MSRPHDQVEDTRQWLRYAGEDLEAAEAMLNHPHIAPRHVCWLAQQSAEKAIKAVLIFLGIHFPRKHDLDDLRNRLPGTWEVTRKYSDLAELTQWAVESRYPDEWPEATNADAQVAVQQARGIWESIRADLRRQGFKADNS